MSGADSLWERVAHVFRGDRMSPLDSTPPRQATAANGPVADDNGSAPSVPLPVVGIGGSAGGIEAMCELLGAVQPDAGLALLLVLDLDPTHDSLLTGILAASAKVPVVLAQDRMPLRPDQAYVIPPNFQMEVAGTNIRLTPRPAGLNMPIDVLFRSMARELGRRAIGVVLSGGGTDGTLGVQEIKSAEGITFAQDEATARHDSMPRSALSTGFIDHVLSPAAIGQSCRGSASTRI